MRLRERTTPSARHNVSIHAPREGCDVAKMTLSEIQREFQFTHPGRGATVLSSEVSQADKVSIHAPREGCDTFYPSYKSFGNKFQFTHPGRGATSAIERASN